MNNIKINTGKIRNTISPDLYGVFFEDINYGGDGGLYAELIPNRSFEYYDKDGKIDKSKMCWQAIGDIKFEIESDNPINNIHTKYAHISGSSGGGIRNLGYCNAGIDVVEDECYKFSCYARTEKPIQMLISLVGSNEDICAQAKIDVESGEWTKFDTEIYINESCKNARLDLTLTEKGSVYIELVSLFPKSTFHGLRHDMIDMIKELKPRFFRFPGGCLVEGRSFENMYNWKETIGPIEQRRTNWNRWQLKEHNKLGRDSSDYFQSYGIGYYEYFLLCEEIGAKPLPVMNVGMTCQFEEGLLVELDNLDKWIQDILDLIEFANGDETTTWGKKRIEFGHKAPFDLEYVGIGNEQWGDEYFERYEIFEDKISKIYPDIKLITSAGAKSEGDMFDLAVDWLKNNKEKAYAVDEHFYKSPEWFLENVSRYDGYDRTMPKVFAGEYAAHTSRNVPDRRNNFYAALTEAAFLTGVERNADHVVMACYAPLFARTDANQWQPNLIWFDNRRVYGTPSYYVQKMFASYIGDYVVETQNSDDDLFIVSSIMNADNSIIIKIVNISDEDKRVYLDIDQEVCSCEICELSAELDDENSHENPINVYPKTMKTNSFDSSQTIKKHSVTVMKLSL